MLIFYINCKLWYETNTNGNCLLRKVSTDMTMVRTSDCCLPTWEVSMLWNKIGWHNLQLETRQIPGYWQIVQRDLQIGSPICQLADWPGRFANWPDWQIGRNIDSTAASMWVLDSKCVTWIDFDYYVEDLINNVKIKHGQRHRERGGGGRLQGTGCSTCKLWMHRLVH